MATWLKGVIDNKTRKALIMNAGKRLIRVRSYTMNSVCFYHHVINVLKAAEEYVVLVET